MQLHERSGDGGSLGAARLSERAIRRRDEAMSNKECPPAIKRLLWFTRSTRIDMRQATLRALGIDLNEHEAAKIDELHRMYGQHDRSDPWGFPMACTVAPVGLATHGFTTRTISHAGSSPKRPMGKPAAADLAPKYPQWDSNPRSRRERAVA